MVQLGVPVACHVTSPARARCVSLTLGSPEPERTVRATVKTAIDADTVAPNSPTNIGSEVC